MADKEIPLLLASCVTVSAALFSTLAWNSRASLHRTVEARVASGADILAAEVAAALAADAPLSNDAASRAHASPGDLVRQAAQAAALPSVPPQPCPSTAAAAPATGGVVSAAMAGETALPTTGPCVPVMPLLATWNRIGADVGARAMILRAGDGSVLVSGAPGQAPPDAGSNLVAIRDLPGTSLRVAYAADPDLVEAQWRKTLGPYAWLTAALAVLLAGVGAWMLRIRPGHLFRFDPSLPWREETPAHSQHGSSMFPATTMDAHEVAPKSLPTVLVVDDDPITRDFVQATLGEYCTVTCAADGREGLRIALEWPPDLLITDEMMPGLSGTAMVQELRRNPTLDEVPIMMLTASRDVSLHARVLGMGAQDFLVKPLEGGVLLARVHALLRDRQRSAARAALSARTLACVLETSKDAVVLIDDQHRIQLINSVGEAMFRCAREHVLGRGIDVLLAPQSWQSFMAKVNTLAPGVGPSPTEGSVKLTGRRGPAEEFPVSCTASRWNDLNGATFIALVLHDEAERLQQDQLLLQAHDELQRVRESLLQEVENRQAAIARELHDSVGSSLAGVSMILGGARSLANATTEPLLVRAHAQIEAAADQLRKISRGVLVGSMPGVLRVALEQFADDLSFLQRIRCTVNARGPIEDIDPAVGTQLYRIVQEASHNALRHGKASTVRIRIMQLADGRCRLTVSDDGVGCDFDRLPATYPGVGLRSMKARAEVIGGIFQLQCNGRRGVRVCVEWLADGTAATTRPADLAPVQPLQQEGK